jgi:hypothetical protein
MRQENKTRDNTKDETRDETTRNLFVGRETEGRREGKKVSVRETTQLTLAGGWPATNLQQHKLRRYYLS